MNIPKKCHKIKVFKGIELIKTIRKTIKEIRITANCSVWKEFPSLLEELFFYTL